MPEVIDLRGLFQPVMSSALVHQVRRGGAEVGSRFTVHALTGVAAMIDTLFAPAFGEHLVGERGPAGACVFHPCRSVHRAALRCAAACGLRRIRAPKPLRPLACDAVIGPLGDQHVRVRVVLAPIRVAARVNRERVRQLLLVRQGVNEGTRQGDLRFAIEVTRQREVGAHKQTPVRALVQIGGLPVFPRVILGPCGHVVRFRVDHFVEVTLGKVAGPRHIRERRAR